jgi:hypothetical protein
MLEDGRKKDVMYEGGKPADVYSFGILLWVCMSGDRTPYPDDRVQKYRENCQLEGTEMSMFEHMIKSGERPLIDKQHLPSESYGNDEQITALMKRCWSPNFTERPEFHDIYEELLRIYYKHGYTRGRSDGKDEGTF